MNLNTNRNEFVLSFDDEAKFFHQLLDLLITSEDDYQLFIKTVNKTGEITSYDLETSVARRLFKHTSKTLATSQENILIEVAERYNRLVLLFDYNLRIVNIAVNSVDKLIKQDRNTLIGSLPIVMIARGKLGFIFGDKSLNFITFNAHADAGNSLVKKLRNVNQSSSHRLLTHTNDMLMRDAFTSIVKFKTESIACEDCEDLLLILIRGSKINNSLISSINAEIDGLCDDTFLSKKYQKEFDFFQNKAQNFYKNYRSILSEGLKRIEEIT